MMTCTRDTVKATGLNIWVSGEHNHQEPLVDSSVIAVQGLGAHPYYTWVRKQGLAKEASDPRKFGFLRGRQKNSNSAGLPDIASEAVETMWLRDLLPESIPHARIATYSYESDWRRANVKTSLRKCGEQLLNVLHQNRSSEKVSRAVLAFHLSTKTLNSNADDRWY
ncbi:hypothetical protein MMC07_006553 [Pseudocyphellaria aurata]|nr:hypothetical protein [Pseudocyphellaria aurata]